MNAMKKQHAVSQITGDGVLFLFYSFRRFRGPAPPAKPALAGGKNKIGSRTPAKPPRPE